MHVDSHLIAQQGIFAPGVADQRRSKEFRDRSGPLPVHLVLLLPKRYAPARRTPRHLMVHIDGAIKLANPLVSGQADPYTE